MPPITELLAWHLGEDRPPVVLPVALPAPYRLELVHRYEEPTFTECLDEVFFGPTGSVRMTDLGFSEDADLLAFRRAQLTSRPTLRLALRHGQELAGWSFGFADRPNAFFMASSAVRAPHRRRGFYSVMAQTLVDLARQGGFHFVHSRHVCTNNPILIAKLKLGFRVTGLELAAQWGSLLALEMPLSAEREALLLARSGQTRMSPAIAATLSEDRG